MWKPLPFGSVVVCLIAGALSAAERNVEMIQPTQSRSNIVLRSSPGFARVEGQGIASQKIPLRNDEVMTAIAETRNGWTAAGLREKEQSTGLIMIRRNSDGIKRLTVPGSQRHAFRLRPTVVVAEESLEGLAWLEGTHFGALSVRVADWNEDHWDEVGIVAPPARGSQTGLVATRLQDDRWLLAWSAFDGHDDDIMWSVGRAQDWSIPQRVGNNNQRPDITPALVATSEGALLVWSRLVGGDYRLMVARFDGTNWSRPKQIGSAGSLEPGFVFEDGQLHLIYRHAWPEGWSLTEFSTDGRPQRFAVLATHDAARPVLMRSDGEEAELGFPDGKRERIRWEVLP